MKSDRHYFIASFFLTLVFILTGQALAGDIDAKLPDDNDNTSSFQVKDSQDNVLMKVWSGGGVGIGTTDLPDSSVKLDVVNGSIQVTDSDNASLTAHSTNADSRSYLTLISNVSDAQRELRIVNDGPEGGAFHFYDATIDATRMVIDDNGYVGIGTTAPNKKLDVAGHINAIDYYFINNKVLVYNYGGTLAYGWDVNVTEHIFSAGGTERLVIDNVGNVGIGTMDQFGGGAGVLALGNASPVPTGTLTNAAALYASGGDLYAYDAAGNSTLLGPHDRETGEWIFYSKNTRTGRVVRVNMEKLVKKIEQLTGDQFMEEWIEEVKK